ncbi:Ig-like domain-containing protein [Chryseobacterium caseinilyticum]|uniref:DUF11 domain-containing protein n=1 Tax=Chryseobacterium caseinilyticum TaxID=2771428 RepID=A0ABR8ZH42_9FLAO|nr:cadherin-like domain-containing protein [Chryseobacterium caseinilyticum]MBD8084634.1 DUF11 domain-containing protein [Chryseobacterium caseinilyticum]
MTVLLTNFAIAQINPSLEMAGPTAANGVVTSYTTTLQKNTNNTVGNTFATYTNTPLTVTAAVTQQQFPGTNAYNGTAGSLFMGDAVGGVNTDVNAPAYQVMNAFGNVNTAAPYTTDNNQYTSFGAANGNGIDVTANYGFRFNTSVNALGSQSTTGRYKIGEITLTFNRPVKNPRIHLKGLGGSRGNPITFSFTTEFTVKSVINSSNNNILPSTNLSLLSGTNLIIDQNLKTINNSYTGLTSPAGANSGRGTVEITNTNITSIVLEVYMNGNTAGQDWTLSSGGLADAWMLAVSLGESDIQINKFVNPTTVSAGDNVVFTVNATNNGCSNNTNIIVDDILPSGYTYVSHSATPGTYIPSSGVWTIGALNDQATATLSVTARAKSLGMYENSGTAASADLLDPDSSNNTASVAALVDTDRDGVSDSEDLDDDNDGIPDSLEGFCSSTPTLLKSASFSATGAGVTGRPTINFEAPTTGSGRRTVLLLLTVERDHTPGNLGDNWESTAHTAPNNTALMPTVTFGTSTMEKRNYNFAYDAVSGQPSTQARLSRTQYVYALSDSNTGGIPSGLQSIDLSNFTVGPNSNAGDEFSAQVLVYDQVRSIEVGGSNAAFANTSGFPASISVSNDTNATQSSPLTANDILLAFGGNSNGNGMTLTPTWTPLFNSVVTNAGGTFTGFSGIPTGSSENDGFSSAVATLTGVTGNQSITFNFNTNNALLGNATMYRINGFGTCVIRDTDADGIPDFLDLDSDNDGCLDAIEGSATITASQLIAAQGGLSVGTGSTAANQNLPAPVGNTPTTKGIPQLAGTGQAVGTSDIVNQSPCFIDAKNDINQTPINTVVSGSLLTNDVSGEGAVSLLSAQYRNSAGTFVTLTTGTSTSVYSTTGILAGSILLNANGNYTYTPATGFTGTVPLNYTAANAVGGNDTASLEIQVIPVTNPLLNDAPIALNDTGVTKAGVSLTSNVLGNDSDPDVGNTITVTGATQGSTTIGNAGTAVTVTGVNSSGATVTAGTFALTGTGATAGNYTFIPAAGFTGTVNAITYTISDGNGGTDTAVVNIEVKAATAPPVVFANDDAKATVKGVSTSGNMLANDTSTATGTLSVTSVTINGTAAAPTAAGVLVPGVGTITISSTGAYTFLPLPTFVGTYVIPYTTCNNATPTPACSTASLYLTSLDLPGYCYKEPITTATRNQPVKHGITALNRAGSGSTEWPTVRQGAWTVLEAKTKGFVINRTTFVDEDGNSATPTTPPTSAIPAANYVEGMIMYDNGVHCLKVYTGAANGWQCYNTQACPDF